MRPDIWFLFLAVFSGNLVPGNCFGVAEVTEVISVRDRVSLTDRFITSRSGMVLYLTRFSRKRSNTKRSWSTLCKAANSSPWRARIELGTGPVNGMRHAVVTDSRWYCRMHLHISTVQANL